MQIYRVYTMTPQGHIERPPEIVECADNDSAILFARRYLDGRPVEVWEGATRIARLEPEE